MPKKKRTKFRLKDMKTGRVRTVESHSQAYEVGKFYEGVSKLDGSKYWEECVEVTYPAVNATITNPDIHKKWNAVMGISPDQIQEQMRIDRELGFKNIEYHPETGDVRFPDRATRKRYCEAMGVVDFNGGYGDPQPR